MEDKEIIDDVDVAGCGYFCEADNECSICGMGTDGEDTFCKNCKDNSNCYYKQFRRLQQENFELKESLKCFQTPEAIKALTFYKTGEFDLQEKRCIKLEQENARLKNERTADLVKQINELKAENARKKDMIERQWKLLKQCGVSSGGELKRVSYLLEKLRDENKINMSSVFNLSIELQKALDENTELKEENYGLNQELLGYKKGVQASEIIELKQTLQEIKAIAKRKITKNRYELEQKIFEIIQKISEVEE